MSANIIWFLYFICIGVIAYPVFLQRGGYDLSRKEKIGYGLVFLALLILADFLFIRLSQGLKIITTIALLMSAELWCRSRVRTKAGRLLLKIDRTRAELIRALLAIGTFAAYAFFQFYPPASEPNSTFDDFAGRHLLPIIALLVFVMAGLRKPEIHEQGILWPDGLLPWNEIRSLTIIEDGWNSLLLTIEFRTEGFQPAEFHVPEPQIENVEEVIDKHFPVPATS